MCPPPSNVAQVRQKKIFKFFRGKVKNIKLFLRHFFFLLLPPIYIKVSSFRYFTYQRNVVFSCSGIQFVSLGSFCSKFCGIKAYKQYIQALDSSQSEKIAYWKYTILENSLKAKIIEFYAHELLFCQAETRVNNECSRTWVEVENEENAQSVCGLEISFQSIPQVQLTPGKSSAQLFQLFQKKICLSKTADTNIMAYNFFHHILDLQSRFWSGFWPRLGYGSSTVCTRSLDPFYVVGYHIDLNIKHETRSGNGYGISVFHLLCVQCTVYTVHCTLYTVQRRRYINMLDVPVVFVEIQLPNYQHFNSLFILF